MHGCREGGGGAELPLMERPGWMQGEQIEHMQPPSCKGHKLTARTHLVLVAQGITAQMGTRATDRRATKLMRIHQQVRQCAVLAAS